MSSLRFRLGVDVFTSVVSSPICWFAVPDVDGAGVDAAAAGRSSTPGRADLYSCTLLRGAPRLSIVTSTLQ